MHDLIDPHEALRDCDCQACAIAERDRLRELLNRRPALNAGTLEAYAAWTAEVYASDACATNNTEPRGQAWN